MTGWEWDVSLFAGAARYYEEGRLPYAPGLGAGLRSVASDPGRLLDVGCGPGSVALRAAGDVGDVVGVDADPDMILEARRLAA
ncbi:MAG TPA: methyltransferase domain-containing protein, partial [Mycobacteriales bacterium]|nr:methyltransferase domain-containing protein [Mycobacteriales bacterium]